MITTMTAGIACPPAPTRASLAALNAAAPAHPHATTPTLTRREHEHGTACMPLTHLKPIVADDEVTQHTRHVAAILPVIAKARKATPALRAEHGRTNFGTGYGTGIGRRGSIQACWRIR